MLSLFRRRLGALLLAIFPLLLSAAVTPGVPDVIVTGKIAFHAQFSAPTVTAGPVAVVFEADFPEVQPNSVSVTLQRPDATTVPLDRQTNGSFLYSEYFLDEAKLAASFPNGSYRLLVAGGSSPSTTTFDFTVNAAAPVRITNFDSMITAPASVQPTWQPIPTQGSFETLQLELWSSGGVELSSTELSSARATTGTLSNLVEGETYYGMLYYISYASTFVNSGNTEVVSASAFQVAFPVYRSVATAVAPTTPPAAGAYASGPNEVTLSWQSPSGGTPATSFRIERASDAAFQNGLVTLPTNSGATSYIDTTVSPNTEYHYRVSAVNSAGVSAPTAEMVVRTLASTGVGATRFANIATRAYCSTGNSVTIGGFVVGGTGSKRVIVRAVGPSLSAQGIPASELLADPSIEVFRGATSFAANDDWTTRSDTAEMTAVGGRIGASALLASDTKSSALLLTLTPGVYSFVVSGKASSSGIVLLEAFDADEVTPTASFVNIASRASSVSGNGVTIGGFVISGGAAKRVLVRAVGPTLSTQGLGVAEVLANPTIELHRGAPIIATNDNWATNANASAMRSTAARIGAAAFASSDTASSALLLTLPPGVYSFIARGRDAGNGIVLVEVYDAD